MYGINKTVNLDFLIGKELLQLCIGLYQLILNFSDQVSIATECMIRLCDPDGAVVDISSDSPELTRVLICLLGRSVETVNTEIEGEIAMFFSGGFKLFVFDSNEDEESFTVTTPDVEIVV